MTEQEKTKIRKWADELIEDNDKLRKHILSIEQTEKIRILDWGNLYQFSLLVYECLDKLSEALEAPINQDPCWNTDKDGSKWTFRYIMYKGFRFEQILHDRKEDSDGQKK